MDVPDWQSPVKWVVPLIPAAPAAAAPERVSEIQQAVRGLKLVFEDGGHFRCAYSRRSGQIVISRKAVEVFWVASYTYLHLATAMSALPTHERHVELDLQADDFFKPATDLLHWAFETWMTTSDAPWPPMLPMPSRELPDGPIRDATNLSLIVISYVIFHEISHHTLGHVRSEPHLEHDADYEAAEWLLNGVDPSDPQFTFRAFGIATALSILTARGIQGGKFGSRSHPPQFDRLYNTLNRYVADDHHAAWFMAVAILRLHLDASKILIPPGEYEHAKACVEDYVQRLSEIAEGSSEA